MSRHRIRVFQWIEGSLYTSDFFSESFEEAKEIAKSVEFETARIYDEFEHMVHEVKKEIEEELHRFQEGYV